MNRRDHQDLWDENDTRSEVTNPERADLYIRPIQATHPAIRGFSRLAVWCFELLPVARRSAPARRRLELGGWNLELPLPGHVLVPNFAPEPLHIPAYPSRQKLN